jgi:peptidoglycan/LPS O-acetylase OafA/YrhL
MLIVMTRHNRIPALDGVRGFAAAWVFLYHYVPGQNSSSFPIHFIWAANQIDWVGVSLFFVLSGFLISGILWDSFEDKNWWRNFYIKRSLRIFPLYFLALLIAVAVYSAVGADRGSLQHLWIYIFYLQDVPPLYAWGGHLPAMLPLGHLWSLAVEEQFYMLWPISLFVLARKRYLAMYAIFILWLLSFCFRLVVCKYLGYQAMFWSGGFLAGRAGELLAGAFLALLVRGDAIENAKIYKCVPWALYGSLAGIASIVYINRSFTLFIPLMSTVGLALLSVFFTGIIALSLRPGTIQSFFQSQVLRWLGTISYGVYVYQLMLHPLFDRITQRIVPDASKSTHAIVLFVVAVVGTLTSAALSFYCYEQPLLRLKTRFSAESRGLARNISETPITANP